MYKTGLYFSALQISLKHKESLYSFGTIKSNFHIAILAEQCCKWLKKSVGAVSWGQNTIWGKDITTILWRIRKWLPHKAKVVGSRRLHCVLFSLHAYSDVFAYQSPASSYTNTFRLYLLYFLCVFELSRVNAACAVRVNLSPSGLPLKQLHAPLSAYEWSWEWLASLVICNGKELKNCPYESADVGQCLWRRGTGLWQGHIAT